MFIVGVISKIRRLLQISIMLLYIKERKKEVRGGGEKKKKKFKLVHSIIMH